MASFGTDNADTNILLVPTNSVPAACGTFHGTRAGTRRYCGTPVRAAPCRVLLSTAQEEDRQDDSRSVRGRRRTQTRSTRTRYE